MNLRNPFASFWRFILKIIWSSYRKPPTILCKWRGKQYLGCKTSMAQIWFWKSGGFIAPHFPPLFGALLCSVLCKYGPYLYINCMFLSFSGWGVTFHSLLVTRWNSLIACYLLQNHSLLVAKIHSLLFAEVAHCKISLVTRCKIRLLIVAEVARCKRSLVTHCEIRLLIVAEVALCKKSLVTRCQIRLLLVTEVASCKTSLVTRCDKSLVTQCQKSFITF